jgi:hypothetical protein
LRKEYSYKWNHCFCFRLLVHMIRKIVKKKKWIPTYCELCWEHDSYNLTLECWHKKQVSDEWYFLKEIDCKKCDKKD